MPTLLAVIPHPDDESYSFAGTIALAADAGWDCLVHCATYGEGGERHDEGPPGRNALADAREAELRESCRILGARPPEFWGLPDGELALHSGESVRLARLFQTERPDVVFALGPDGAYGHPDHLALHRWLVAAWEQAPEPRPVLLLAAFPPGLFSPQYEKCVSAGIMGEPPSLAPDALGTATVHYDVPIARVRSRKRAAIAAHRTQLPGGEPEALFPSGIVPALLKVERFVDARGAADSQTAALLASLAAPTSG